MCPATTQTAHFTWETAYGELHHLKEIQWEATVHRAEYVLHLTDRIYICFKAILCNYDLSANHNASVESLLLHPEGFTGDTAAWGKSGSHS